MNQTITDFLKTTDGALKTPEVVTINATEAGIICIESEVDGKKDEKYLESVQNLVGDVKDIVFTEPFVFVEGKLVKGNNRMLAIRDLGLNARAYAVHIPKMPSIPGLPFNFG